MKYVLVRDLPAVDAIAVPENGVSGLQNNFGAAPQRGGA